MVYALNDFTDRSPVYGRVAANVRSALETTGGIREPYRKVNKNIWFVCKTSSIVRVLLPARRVEFCV